MDHDELTFEGTRMVAEKCLCTNVQQAARSIGRRFDAAFRPVDLTNWQFTLLVALHRRKPPTMNVLAKDLAIDRTTITGSLKPLERRGLVHVRQDAADKRVRRVELTEAGSDLLQKAYVIWKQVAGAVERDLAIDDIDGFRASLRAATAV